MSSGRLLILSAPSGAGKTSLAKAVVDTVDRAVRSVSHTTRARRPDEQEGRDYHFIGADEFEAMIERGAFLEHARVFDHWYGTARAPLEALVSDGRIVVLDIDWQGARKVRSQLPEAVSVFILPPSLQSLEDRLRARRQDAETVIQRRMRDAVAEMTHYDEYDHVVVNDDFDLALADIRAIVEERLDRVRSATLDIESMIGGREDGPQQTRAL